MSRSRKSLRLAQELQKISMVDEKDKYLCKQQELVDALTDEMSELYRAQDAIESKLDRILGIITNDPDKAEEINKHWQVCPRRDELDALSMGIITCTEKLIRWRKN